SAALARLGCVQTRRVIVTDQPPCKTSAKRGCMRRWRRGRCAPFSPRGFQKMVWRPIPGAPTGAPIPPFPSSSGQRRQVIHLPDTMSLDSTPAPGAKWQSEARVRVRQNIARLLGKRTLNKRGLHDLQRDQAWLREQDAHDRDADLFDLWCLRIAAMMPEFSAYAAKMICMYA